MSRNNSVREDETVAGSRVEVGFEGWLLVDAIGVKQVKDNGDGQIDESQTIEWTNRSSVPDLLMTKIRTWSWAVDPSRWPPFVESVSVRSVSRRVDRRSYSDDRIEASLAHHRSPRWDGDWVHRTTGEYRMPINNRRCLDRFHWADRQKSKVLISQEKLIELRKNAIDSHTFHLLINGCLHSFNSKIFSLSTRDHSTFSGFSHHLLIESIERKQ